MQSDSEESVRENVRKTIEAFQTFHIPKAKTNNKDSHLTSALFYKDKAGKMDVVNTLEQDASTGLKQIHAYTRESKSVAMEGKIHSDLFAQDRYILGAVPIKIKLVRSRNPFCLVSSAECPNFKVVIEECLFRVRRVDVALIVL
jgi:hypothetical protein